MRSRRSIFRLGGGERQRAGSGGGSSRDRALKVDVDDGLGAEPQERPHFREEALLARLAGIELRKHIGREMDRIFTLEWGVREPGIIWHGR